MKYLWLVAVVITFSACASKPTKEQTHIHTTISPVAGMRFELNQPPSIGTTDSGQELHLGGFSGLRYIGKSANGRWQFLTHTDRGPNPEPYEENGKVYRPFLLPAYQPRLVFLQVDSESGTMEVSKQLLLMKPDGGPLTGIPQPPHLVQQEFPVNLYGESLAFDPYGMDLESIELGDNGSYWMSEEYGPSVLHVSAEGKLLDIFKPGAGLPKVVANRRLNRGFEGIARWKNSLYAILQSPLDNPHSAKEKNAKNSRVVRILELDIPSGQTIAQYAYILESNKIDKIGDLFPAGKGKLLVVERDGTAGEKGSRKVFLIDMNGATNLQLQPEKIAGMNGSLETMKENLRNKKIRPVKKTEVFDLAKAGVVEEKVEGLALVDEKYLAVVVDNDFALGGELNRKTGRVDLKKEPSVLYVFPFSWEKHKE